MKRMFFKRSWAFLAFVFLIFISVPHLLFSASITNEGPTIAKVNGRSPKGIVGGVSIKPGQSLQLKNEFLWIEHVPDGNSSEVNLKITENDGHFGYITTPGGRYVFQKEEPGVKVEAEKKKAPDLKEGYAENRSNLAMLLSLITKDNQQSYSLLLPGQKVVIPKNVVEVIADRHGWSSGDVQITVFLVMPDGKENMIRTPHAVVRIGDATDR